MENIKLCNWLLHYSEKNLKCSNSYNNIDVESSVTIKQKFCSSMCYFECGKNIFEVFPDASTGFVGVLNYLYSNKCNVMDRLEDEEQRSYIDKLKNIDDFAMRHHISVIKCFMKIYACRLAPYEMINHALEILGVSGIGEEGKSILTFRYVKRWLLFWLKSAAVVGISKLSYSTKNVSDSEAESIVGNSSVGSLLLYAIMSYVDTKLFKYTVKIPEVGSIRDNSIANSDLSFEHSRIVYSMFVDICDNKDLLPLDMDGLISRSQDTVPSILTIALVFHWVIATSSRQFVNRLPLSKSCAKSDRNPSQRPNHLSCNNNFNDTIDPTQSHSINSTKPPNDNLRQLFSKAMISEDRGRGCVNRSIKSSLDGDTSSDVFLTPTDEEYPANNGNCISPPIKLLPYKLIDNYRRAIGYNSTTDLSKFGLKSEFQKRLKEKQGLPKASSIFCAEEGYETTWMAQSNKTEVTHVPLSPKKPPKSSNNFIKNHGSMQNLSPGQLSEIQSNLRVQRRKIETVKKIVAEETEKKVENSKQKAFFQAVVREKKVVIRRRSLEGAKDDSNNDRSEADKRLSMYIKRTSENVVISPVRRLGSRDISQLFKDASNKGQYNSHGSEVSVSSSLANQDNNVMEPFQSSPQRDISSPEIHVELEQTNGTQEDDDSIRKNEIEKVHAIDAAVDVTKNSSFSISSLSSFSNRSPEKNFSTKKEGQKKAEVINVGVSSYRRNEEESCVENCSQDMQTDNEKIKSENNSLEETPTTNVMSLTDVTDISKHTTEAALKQIDSSEQLESSLARSGLDESKIKEDSACGISSKSQMLSRDDLNIIDCDGDQRIHIIMDEEEPPGGNTPLIDLPTRVNVEDNETPSFDMVNARPISFLVDDKALAEFTGKKTELSSKGEERRILKKEQFMNKRDLERENRINAVSEDSTEHESKKVVHQEKRDGTLNKNDDSSSVSLHDSKSISLVVTPVKAVKKSPAPRSNIKFVKPESVTNLSSVSLRKNNGYSSIQPNSRFSSKSTSKLNVNAGQNLGAGLPSQEYIGPKLFVKQKSKSNRSVIANAIMYCCLAGSVNTILKDTVLKELNETEGNHFMILFRDSRCQYKSLYLFDCTTEELLFISGNGPKRINHEMVEKFFKYNSGTKQFNAISSTKHLSTSVDAVCIQSSHWNTKSNQLTSASSTSAISLGKTKR